MINAANASFSEFSIFVAINKQPKGMVYNINTFIIPEISALQER